MSRNGRRRDVVVVGGSSGALQALQFISDLPPDFQASIFIVIHVSASGPGLLPSIIRRYSPLPVEHARDGEPIESGRIYVAPPDYHLLLRRDVVRVVHGAKENRHRPSIDVLFRSAAEAYGPRVIAVLLSGLLDDGSAGLSAVRSRGGLSIIQDPRDASFADMPLNALAIAGADYSVRSSEIATLLTKALTEEVPEEERKVASSEIAYETAIAESDMGAIQQDEKPGKPSAFSCPDCGGVLWEVPDDNMLRFKCRVGHGLTAESLLSAQTENLEAALWSSLRALEEKADLLRRLMEYSRQRNYMAALRTLENESKKMEEHAAIIREVLVNGKDHHIETTTSKD
jgi:two-component system chemotaxis response regulator CheB